MFKGIAASQGIAVGKALVIREVRSEIKRIEIGDVDSEKNRFRQAVKTAEEQLEKVKLLAEKKFGQDKAQIFEAHILMLQDPEFIGAVELKIESENVNSEFALKCTVDMFAEIFEEMDNEYMRERAEDIKDVGGRIINILSGNENLSLSEIYEECIIVTKDLTPSQTAQMNKDKVLGFATETGGRTSHSAIMARSLEIPAVVGLGPIIDQIKNGDMLVIDGDEGVLIVNPKEELLQSYKSKQQEIIEYKKELKKLCNLEAKTVDGRKVEIAGNIGSSLNVTNVVSNGGEGIGLFRTEFLYMDSDTLPTEEMQFHAYREVLEKMNGMPVVIRTLDIGGDKKLPYLPIGEEMNPFLGFRAIRLCLERKDIFKTQLRALLRASVYGNLKIMFPMISNLQEVREAKRIAEEVKQELAEKGISYSHNVEIGIMIEIPSAALISDIIAKEVDFFSIGTNDLVQYTAAVDRMNEKVAYLYDHFNPSVLRIIKFVIDNAHKSGKWVGMCGEMAGDDRAIPVLLGMELDEFSMSPSSMLKAKKLIRNLNFEKCKKISEEVLKLGTAEEIKKYIDENIK